MRIAEREALAASSSSGTPTHRAVQIVDHSEVANAEQTAKAQRAVGVHNVAVKTATRPVDGSQADE